MSNQTPHVAVVFGTRPEWIKVEPVINALKDEGVDVVPVFSGQHKDLIGDFEQAVPDPDVNEYGVSALDVGLQKRIGVITHSIPHGTTHILVQGDTTTALAGALVGFNNKILVGHIEAGMRSNNYDHPYPEEMYRCLISQIADYHFCPTNDEYMNLLHAKAGSKKFVVGNTVLDGLPDPTGDPIDNLNVYVTLHRRENHEILELWYERIIRMANEYPELLITMIGHPNPHVTDALKAFKEDFDSSGVRIIDPVSRDEMIKMIQRSRFLITDSGGLQEECSYLKRKCIVCRDVTERPQAVNKTSFLTTPNNFYEVFKQVHYNPTPIKHMCPFGGGTASKKIAKILADEGVDKV